jgi:catechol 2,3-dioxygenase-like lactoylglutathione lyase family enzyme
VSDTQTTTQITQAGTVFVPVADQDPAIDFYADKLGFEKRSDFVYAGDVRWVEMVPPGAATSVSLVAAGNGQAAGIETRVALVTADVEADHARLRSLGVDVGEIIREGDPVQAWGGAVLGGIPPMFLLRDLDGNSYLVVAAL